MLKKKKENNEDETTIEYDNSYHKVYSEDLISGLTYRLNQVMRFQSIKNSYILFDLGNFSTPNESRKFIEYFDFVIAVTEANKTIENNVEKEIFSGLIFLENYMIDNETEMMLVQNSSLLDGVLSSNEREDVWMEVH